MTSSNEQIALARRIVAKFVWTPEDGNLSKRTGPQQATARDMEKAALAAIIETTELAAAWINCAHGLPTHDYEPGFNEVAGLRAFAHLKGPAHDEQ